jgi:transposase
MRGQITPQAPLFHVIEIENLIPAKHPLRDMKRRVDAELRKMQPRFAAAYSTTGRPSIPPEQIIKATLLQALYSVRSERLLCEQIKYNFLYRWFLDLPLDDGAVWDHSTFSTNRERFAQYDLMGDFFRSSTVQAVQEQAASCEHFSIDGTLIEAWASMKSFQPREEKPDVPNDSHKGDGASTGADKGSASNRWVDWKKEKRSNETHMSRTDPEARLMRKGDGREARLSHSLHVEMENRNGLIMDIDTDAADGTAERRAGLRMLRRTRDRKDLSIRTAGMDKGYDDGAFILEMEEQLGIEAHVALKAEPKKVDSLESLARSRVHARRSTPGYIASRRIRMRIEEIMGWLKNVAGLRKTRFVGRWKTQLYAFGSAAAYNFLRLGKLCPA